MDDSGIRFERQKLRLEMARVSQAAELGKSESYNTRATALASLSTLAISLVFGFESQGLVTSPAGAALSILGITSLVFALIAALTSLWPRSGTRRDQLHEEIAEAVEEPLNDELLEMHILKTNEASRDTRKATKHKRRWTRRAYAALASGVIFLAAGSIVTALDKI